MCRLLETASSAFVSGTLTFNFNPNTMDKTRQCNGLIWFLIFTMRTLLLWGVRNTKDKLHHCIINGKICLVRDSQCKDSIFAINLNDIFNENKEFTQHYA